MPHPGRYFTHHREAGKAPHFHNEFLESITRIITYNPPVHTSSIGWSFTGLYSGPTSIAYLFYRVSLLYPEITFKRQSYRDWAEEYLKLGIQSRENPPDPKHCGIANELLASLALRSIMHNDVHLAQRICAYEETINGSSDGSNEWLYGRAGYLYLLRLCRSHFETQSGSEAVTAALTQAIERTIKRILDTPLPWTWHGKEYLGAAHGYIGIITQIVLSRTQNNSSGLEHLVEALLKMQYPSGNFPSSARKEYSNHDDRLVQFCHGSPGFVISLSSIADHFPPDLQNKMGVVLEKGRADVWNRGLLTKPPCLCHGIVGNALAFTQPDDNRFEKLLAYSTTELIEANAKADQSRGVDKGWLQDAGRDDAFVGLYTGEAGRAWVWALADKNMPRTCIGYNDV